ncbi:5-formyltetrahydrofolate cyclo-ligase [Fulvivirga lutimaris]|uniref:5-formyltetrahydrofolate cyclo-ligase n=1 Tax=Fulvivirga lutimaris TaxID=1819566 RepID=UPI0012BB8007|nr:5-formyltetrahydrofolate cyclo-ligase [Fulvivirga lutimaris]MTI41778.1 5-formyltetrahydrofolate cyclo-ligase [Fulvivirga lutimaris]
MASKQILREVYLAKRQFLSDDEYELRNHQIKEKFISLLENYSFNAIHTFLPIISKREVDTLRLIKYVRTTRPEVQIFVPKTLRNGHLENYILNDNCIIEENKWGIPEPVEGDLSDDSLIDLVLVPLIISDKLGDRIGYGKGFYDRFLEKIPEAKKVGLSLLPNLDKIEFIETTDIRLDFCITPSQVYHF